MSRLHKRANPPWLARGQFPKPRRASHIRAPTAAPRGVPIQEDPMLRRTIAITAALAALAACGGNENANTVADSSRATSRTAWSGRVVAR